MEPETLNHFRQHFTAILNESGGGSSKQWGQEFLSDGLIAGDQLEQDQQGREDALNKKLRWRKMLYLKKVQRALERIARGEFGACEECGEEIELKRLHARPTAEQCIQCKEAQEQVENHIPYAKRSHTLGRDLQAGPGIGPVEEIEKVDLKVAQEVSERAVEMNL